MKLKTLKDLKIENFSCCKDCGEVVNQDDGWCFECSNTPKEDIIEFCRVNNLKQEAIKRIKFYEVEEQRFMELAKKGMEPQTHLEAANDRRSKINELKDFCSITEEDLMTNEEINAREHGEVANN